MVKSRLAKTSKTIAEDDFNELSDKYYGVIEKVSNIFLEEELTLEESILILDSLTTAITNLKYQSYKDIKDIL